MSKQTEKIESSLISTIGILGEHYTRAKTVNMLVLCHQQKVHF